MLREQHRDPHSPVLYFSYDVSDITSWRFLWRNDLTSARFALRLEQVRVHALLAA